MIDRGMRHWSFEDTATAVNKTSSLMSKSKALSIEQTQTLRRRGRGVPKKSLDTGDRFIDGLKLANAFGVFFKLSHYSRATLVDQKFGVFLN